MLTLALTAAALASVVTLQQPSVSHSSVTMVVQTSGGANDTETLVRTMTALVESDVLGEALRTEVRSPLTASEITENLSVERPPGSSVLTVTYSDVDRERGIATAGALIPAFQDQVTQLEAGQAGGLAPNYAIQPWGGGAVITAADPAPVLTNALIAAVLGLAVGALGALMYQQRHSLVVDVDGARLATGLPVVTLPGPVGRVRRDAHLHPADVMASLTGALPAALGTRVLPRRVLLVSPDATGERTAFAVHFARSLAQDHRQVVLVDADLESGQLSRYLGLTKSPGLAEYVRDDLDPVESLVYPQDGPAAGLAVLPVGLGLPVRSGVPVHGLSRFDHDARVVINAPQPSRHQSLAALLHNVDAVLVLVTLRRTTVAEASQLTSIVSSLADVPAATVVLSDRPEHQPTDRPVLRPPVLGEPSKAALPA